MATGTYWNLDNPKKPWGPLDPDDVLRIPYDFDAWLDGQGTTYVSNLLTPAAGLSATVISVVAGVVLVEVKKDPALELKAGTKYGVTCQITAADGQKKSKTLYFKIEEA